jgi:hypothetical protein
MSFLDWLKSLFFPIPKGDVGNQEIRHGEIASGDDTQNHGHGYGHDHSYDSYDGHDGDDAGE